MQYSRPIAQLLRTAAADVACEVGLSPDLLAQPKKLVRAQAVVVFHLQAARQAEANRALIDRANAVVPMVMIRIAATRPAQQRHRQGTQR